MMKEPGNAALGEWKSKRRAKMSDKDCLRCFGSFTPSKYWHAHCELCALKLIDIGVASERLMLAWGQWRAELE